MHVLVTGGTGFIGRALCPALIAAGHSVTVLSRQPGQHAARLGGVTLIGSLGEARGIEGVINLAGEPLAEGRWTPQRKQAFRDSRIGTTQALVAWMSTLPVKPRVLVSGSAIGYYGPRGDEPLDETAAPGSDFAATLCRDWEAEARKAEALGLRVALIRIGIVLAADGGALAKMLTPFKLALGGPMASGTQVMSWVSRDDLVRLIVWLLGNASASGAYNGTAPAPVSNRDFSKALAAALGRPALFTTPAFVLRTVFGEMAALLLTGQCVLPAKAEREGFVFADGALQTTLSRLTASS
jgi:uncharacterized protein (TIGR01777 family)